MNKNKNRASYLFTINQLEITALPITWIVVALLIGLFSLIAAAMGIGDALLAGIVAMLAHYAGEIAHQVGHSITARRTGYPMHGVEFWGVLGRSIYLQDPDDVPPVAHIRRALGGGIMSISLAVALGIIWLLWQPALPDWAQWVWGFAIFENLVVFGLGAYLPPIQIGSFMNDGATIRHYRNRLKQ